MTAENEELQMRRGAARLTLDRTKTANDDEQIAVEVCVRCPMNRSQMM